MIDTAAKAIAHKLRGKVDATTALEAITINTISDRRVGWAVRSVETL